MTIKRNISVTCGSIVFAMGIGFFMQNNAASAAKTTQSVPQSFDVAVPAAPAYGPADTDHYRALPGFEMPAKPTAPQLNRPSGQSPHPSGSRACDVVMTAEADDNAIVDVEITAPCLPNAQATLHHDGIMVSVVTDDLGHAEIAFPAFSENAVFIAAFGSDHGAIAQADVPGFATLRRAALQWQGDESFELHAYEGGAGFGEPGHIWADAPGNPAQPEHGYVTTLGDPSANGALLAQVYTYPANATAGIELEALAEISASNCGQEVTAQSLQYAVGGGLHAVDLEMTMPSCDAAGDFLILQNMFKDLKLALK